MKFLRGIELENKLGFDELSDNVVSKRICARCGGCVVVCPLNALEYENEEPRLVGKCTNCGLCVRVCPRYQSPYAEMEEFVFGRPRNADQELGIYQRALVARSTDDEILRKAQDGGVVSTLLVSALESGLIDAAIVSGVDPKNRWLPVPTFAKTREEIIACAGTRYSLSPGLPLLKSGINSGLGKMAFVGTPCQILAIRRMQKSLPKYAKSIALTVGLFCSENFSCQGLIFDKIQKELGIDLNDVVKMNIKGKFLIYLKDGGVREIPLKEAKKFTMPPCQHCGDFSAELADISCGGVGLEGWTYTLIRTDRGANVFDDAAKKSMLKVEPAKNFELPTKILTKLSKGKRSRLSP